MAGFVYRSGHQLQHNVRAATNISMAAPGYGPYYNPGAQNIEKFTRQFGSFSGIGLGGNVNFQPVQMQRQMYYNKPCGGNDSNSDSATWVEMRSNPYDKNGGTQTIQGDVVQRGNFNGRGIGVRIHGQYSVSGDIN